MKKTLKQLLEKNGFEIINIYKCTLSEPRGILPRILFLLNKVFGEADILLVIDKKVKKLKK